MGLRLEAPRDTRALSTARRSPQQKLTSEQQLYVAGDGGDPRNFCLPMSRFHRHLRQRASFPTDGANCKDTIPLRPTNIFGLTQ